MTDYFDNEAILHAPPVKRAAYSDRTAWLFAELCRLIYEPLPSEQSLSAYLAEIRLAVHSGAADDTLAALLQRASDTGDTGTQIANMLRRAYFELVEDFSAGGTEGVIARLSPCEHFEGMLVVAFRGTQPCMRDIATDLKANLVAAPGGGRIHSGFFEAFAHVRRPIERVIAANPDIPVYFTGHSLGGALALIATRYLGADSTGATYTFGCPRVADDDFFCQVKTPVYRIVNSTDYVSRLPFGFGFTLLLGGLRLLPINGTFQISEWLRKRLCGYTHHGDLTFLRPTAPADRTTGLPRHALLVKRSPNVFVMAAATVPRWLATRGRSGISDHAIAQYAMKLHDYAGWRNSIKRQQP